MRASGINLQVFAEVLLHRGLKRVRRGQRSTRLDNLLRREPQVRMKVRLGVSNGMTKIQY